MKKTFLAVMMVAVLVGCNSRREESVESESSTADDSEIIVSEVADSVPTVALAESESRSARGGSSRGSSADTVAVFPGGSFDMFLMRHLEFPESALRDSVNGVVEITFVIDPEGNLTNARVTRSVREDIDKAALGAVRKSPRWKPAPDGQPHECRQVINFQARPTTKPAPRGR